jgi:hypothetical protein
MSGNPTKKHGIVQSIIGMVAPMISRASQVQKAVSCGQSCRMP